MHPNQQVVFNPSAQLAQGRILGHNVNGLFQRYILVDAQSVHDGLVQPAQEDLPSICGALVEPLGGIIYAHELISHIVPDLQSIAVFGAGPIGLLLAKYLHGTGTRFLLLHPRQARLDTAVELDLVPANATMTLGDTLSERMLDWNGAQYFDAAVICTSIAGAPTALGQAVRIVKSGGCIEMITNFPRTTATPEGISAEALQTIRAANICGIPPEGAYVTAEIKGRRIAFTSHRGTSRVHIDHAMRSLCSSASRYTPLITHVIAFEQAARAISSLANSRQAPIEGRDCIKAVIDMTRP